MSDMVSSSRILKLLETLKPDSPDDNITDWTAFYARRAAIDDCCAVIEREAAKNAETSDS